MELKIVIVIDIQGINISHLGKRKIIFKMPFWGDMLVPWGVDIQHQVEQHSARHVMISHTCSDCTKTSVGSTCFLFKLGKFANLQDREMRKEIERVRILSYLSGFSKQKCTTDGCNPGSLAFGYANDCFLICMTGHTKFTTFLVGGINHNHNHYHYLQLLIQSLAQVPMRMGEQLLQFVGPLVRSLEMEGHGASISRIIRPFIGTRYNSI